MASFLGFVRRNYATAYPTPVPKTDSPLRFGVLGAARITPKALLGPSKTHADVVIAGVAARDLKRAEEAAVSFGPQCKAYGSYQELLDDPSIDCIYNPLPNGLHFEWTMRSLAAGKHVLLEKPAGNTADEVERMTALAKEKGLVLLEAFHYRHHPAVQAVRKIVESGVLGELKSAKGAMVIPQGRIKDDDIRFSYDLGGGALTDVGTYAMNSVRYTLGLEPTSVVKTDIIPHPSNPAQIDRGMTVSLLFGSLPVEIEFDLQRPITTWIPYPPDISVSITGTKGSVFLNNFAFASIWHNITLEVNGKSTSVKAYTFEGEGEKGEDSWTTYRWQLESFVDKVRGRSPKTWVDLDDSVKHQKALDLVYAASGLGLRPNSTFKL